VSSAPFADENWDPDGQKEAWFVEVDWDDIRDIDDRIPVEELLVSVPRIPWNYLFSSGSPVGPDEDMLERVWRRRDVKESVNDMSQGYPAEVTEDALELLRRLIGIPIRTATGRVNMIKGVVPPVVTVATDRSPAGQPVEIQWVQDALDILRQDGSVEISPESLGHRSSFVGAVLLTLPGGRIYGSPPIFTVTSAASEDRSDSETVVTFEGDLSAYRIAEQRGEQAILRRTLLGSAQEAACALCGRAFPVQFLRAAHIKPRSVCDAAERRDIGNIAMAACVLGCDSLYEFGLISVDADGAVVTTSMTLAGAIGDLVDKLDGKRVGIFGRGNAEYFAWHRENKFFR
jgi:hypothetical protein